jgi:hypothetical protein
VSAGPLESFIPAQRRVKLVHGASWQTATYDVAIEKPEANGLIMVRVCSDDNDAYHPH